MVTWAVAIYVFDTGSEDGTWESVQQLAVEHRCIKPLVQDAVSFPKNGCVVGCSIRPGGICARATGLPVWTRMNFIMCLARIRQDPAATARNGGVSPVL